MAQTEGRLGLTPPGHLLVNGQADKGLVDNQVARAQNLLAEIFPDEFVAIAIRTLRQTSPLYIERKQRLQGLQDEALYQALRAIQIGENDRLFFHLSNMPRFSDAVRLGTAIQGVANVRKYKALGYEQGVFEFQVQPDKDVSLGQLYLGVRRHVAVNPGQTIPIEGEVKGFVWQDRVVVVYEEKPPEAA